MKRFYAFLTLAVVFAMATFAQAPQGTQLAYNGQAQKHINTLKAVTSELVALPDGVTAETNWAVSGSYMNSNTPYTNENAIAVAFDGNDVYIQGLSYLCPTAWIKGTMEDNIVTFPVTYMGDFTTSDGSSPIYLCGYASTGAVDMVFVWDPDDLSFTVEGYLIENSSSTTISYFFYCADLKVYKDVEAPAVPTDLTVEPTATTGDAAWVSDGPSWDLRYRPYIDMTPYNRVWDFEDAVQAEDFTIVDKDGDGYGWEITNRVTTTSGDYCMVSKSYDNSIGALHPDNWLISPKTTLGGTLTFNACGQDPNYAKEKFAVYVFQGDTYTSVDDFVKQGDDVTTTGTMTTYTYDLSAYEGVGYVAIRHYNVTDMFYLNIDDLAIVTPLNEDAPENEWIYAYDVTNPYLIEGLTPETEYEVQVRAIDEKASAWTPSTMFTTLTDHTAIDAVKTDKDNSNVWYDMMGRSYNGKPATAGIYINNGVKVVVK